MNVRVDRILVFVFTLLVYQLYDTALFVQASDESIDVAGNDNDAVFAFPQMDSDNIKLKMMDSTDRDAVSDGTEENTKEGSVDILAQPKLNETVAPLQNETQVFTKNGTEIKIHCALRVLLEDEIPVVHLVNSSALVKALIPVPNVTSGECAVVMFYSPYCSFSAKAALHFNAIARYFPQINFYAIDAITYTSLNMRYGLVAVPTVLLFHNGKASVKYNDSEPTLEKMVLFITKYTGLSPEGMVSIMPEDSIGPISSVPLARRDYVLMLSWIFTISFCCVWFSKSALCRRMVECIRNTWQEAEAQHEHED